MKTKRILALLLALVMVLSMSMVAYAAEGEADAEPVYGGTLSMYWREIENYYDPAMLTTYGYGSFWMEPLWTIDLSSDNPYSGSYVTYDQLMGQIADSWEWDEDAGTLTVNIRDDVFFHDKEPVNGRQLVAEDVKYTYDRVLATGSGFDEPVETENNWRAELYMVESVETDGDYTVIFQFSGDNHNEIALNDFMICPLNITSHEWDESPKTWEYAYGTGPFVLTGTEIGTTLEFTKNENYYDYDERYPENKLPYLDAVKLTQIDDSSNRLAQFLSGNIEWLSHTSNVLSTAEIAQLQSSMDESRYNTYVYPSGRPFGMTLRNDVEPFSDIRVRQALQMAINLEEIHQGYLMFDYDMLIPGLWTPSLSDFVWEQPDDVKAEFEYNPERAKELLAEAGYPDGFEFDCVVCSIISDVDLYVLVSTYLAQIGVTMNVVTVGDIMEMIQANTDPAEERAMNTTYGGAETVNAAVMIYSETGSNYGLRHHSQEFEDAIAAYQTATTMEERVEAAQKMDELFVTNHWALCLGGVQNYYEFTSSAVQGYQGTRITTNNWVGPVVSHVWKTAE